MKPIKKPVTLYFINGLPTQEQVNFAQANALRIRDANKCYPNDAFENCDLVIGNVPKQYAERHEYHDLQEQASALAQADEAESGKQGSSDNEQPENTDKENSEQSEEEAFDRKDAFKALRDAGVTVPNNSSDEKLKEELAKL